jgi:hypothetical protein
MALHHQPKIVTDGLIFSYDMANGKSFIGGPVTNTLPTPAVNGLPTFGNGWATYNTNQYNGNAYFSIGSISSVASNIVTTSGNHPLRSYDVVTPQTTGGGVAAGTNYLVKKLSNTTFSLHPWNGSQDGSQGFINPATGNHKVYDDFANDVRISVNASSFPTMWWGPPHLPNSALVKEIIPNGFTGIPGRLPTDCVRLHFNRTDATDGMAYGPDASVTAGVLHTVSFWARSVTASAVGTTGSYQIYNYGATTPTGYSIGYTLGPVGVWQKYILQFTPNNPLAISYWFPGSGGIKYDISNIQFEVGSVANKFAPGTRSNTQAIVDLTNNNVIQVSGSNLVYNESSIVIPNVNDSFILAVDATRFRMGIQNFTIGAWVKQLDNAANIIVESRGSSLVGYLFLLNYPSTGNICIFINSGGTQSIYAPANTTLPTGVVQHIVVSVDRAAATATFYLNGVLFGTVTGIQTNSISPSGGDIYRIGYDLGGSTTNMEIYAYSHYNRALSAAEVQQNFQALRGRYGI